VLELLESPAPPQSELERVITPIKLPNGEIVELVSEKPLSDAAIENAARQILKEKGLYKEPTPAPPKKPDFSIQKFISDLGESLKKKFGVKVEQFGPGSIPTSLHKEGRALDIRVRSKEEGDGIFADLMKRRAELGWTALIWQGKVYSKKNAFKGAPYSGPSPHTDHVHLEWAGVHPPERGIPLALKGKDPTMTREEAQAEALRQELAGHQRRLSKLRKVVSAYARTQGSLPPTGLPPELAGAQAPEFITSRLPKVKTVTKEEAEAASKEIERVQRRMQVINERLKALPPAKEIQEAKFIAEETQKEREFAKEYEKKYGLKPQEAPFARAMGINVPLASTPYLDLEILEIKKTVEEIERQRPDKTLQERAGDFIVNLSTGLLRLPISLVESVSQNYYRAREAGSSPLDASLFTGIDLARTLLFMPPVENEIRKGFIGGWKEYWENMEPEAKTLYVASAIFALAGLSTRGTAIAQKLKSDLIKKELARARSGAPEAAMMMKQLNALSPEQIVEHSVQNVKNAVEKAKPLLKGQPNVELKQLVKEAIVKAESAPEEELLPVFRPPAVETLPETPSTKVPPAPTGLARVFEDPERAARGLSPTKKVALSDKALAKKGKALFHEGKIDTFEALRRSVETGEALTPEEAAVAAYQKRTWMNEYQDLLLRMERTPDPTEKIALAERTAHLEDYLGLVSEAAQNTRTLFHDLGEALQVGLEPDFTFHSLKLRAKAKNFGQDLPKDVEMKLKGVSERVQKAEGVVRETASAAIKEFEKSSFVVDVQKGEELSKRALTSLKNLGVPLSEEAISFIGLSKKELAGRSLKGRQRGAVQIPAGFEAKLESAIRTLAKSYVIRGKAKNFDDVLNLLKKDVPALSETDLLRALSGKYKQAELTMNVAKADAMRILNSIKRQAEFRLLSTGGKAFYAAIEILNGLSRTLKASGDLSFAFIQGAPALLSRPNLWLKAWKPTVEVLAKGEKGYVESLAKIKASPFYPFMRKAGLEFTDALGEFSAQEEYFAGGMLEYLRKQPGIGPLVEPIQRTNFAFSTFLNELRADWFIKGMAAGGKDPDFLKSLAFMINVMTGRGAGLTARALGHSPTFGAIIFAPRYSLSQWQYTFFPLIALLSMKGKGRAFALREWGTQMAVLVMSAAALVKAGFEVDLDPRSSTFLKVYSPDGKKWDLASKLLQPLRVLSQAFLGAQSPTGRFTKPGDFGHDVLGKYFMQKAAPLARSTALFLTKSGGGKIFDPVLEKQREVKAADFLWSYAPMPVEDLLKKVAAKKEVSAWDILSAIAGRDFGQKLFSKELPPSKRPSASKIQQVVGKVSSKTGGSS